MPLRIIEQDITTMHVDAIVNSTNHSLIGFSGVDRIIHELGGEELEDECFEKRDLCVPGDAIWTNAYNLNCRYIIHTVGMRWQGGIEGEAAIQRSCYRRSLEVAEELGCRSIAFPLINAGSMNCPVTEALANAVQPISEHLELYSDMDVYLCLFGESAVAVAEEMFAGLDEYISQNLEPAEVTEKAFSVLGDACASETVTTHNRQRGRSVSGVMSDENLYMSKENLSLDEMLENQDSSFVEMLYHYMDEKGIEKDSQLYNKAGISKATFNKLINHKSRNPSLQTAVGLAMALELTYDETQELLASAGMTLSNSSTYDIIVKYFIQTGHYNIWDLNLQLLNHGYEKLIGA